MRPRRRQIHRSTSTQEGQADTAFDQGKAAFEINYPFVWDSAKKTGPKRLQGDGVRGLPPRSSRASAPHVSIGGYNLGISSHSQHPQLAFAATKCLIQAANQKTDAIKGGLAPVATSIYSDPAFDKAYPFHDLIKTQLETYGLRPQTPAYADVTLAIQKALSPTSGIAPNSVVSKLSSEIKSSLSSAALL